MASGIGETLRKARNRRKLPLFEIEAEIRIRVRYLSAIEAEEWDALPEGSYTRSFIRTYANYLGLDGDRLAGEFGGAPPAAGEAGAPRAQPARPGGQSRRASPGSGRSRALVAAVVVAVLAVAVAAIALIGGDSPGGSGEVAQNPPEATPATNRAPATGRSSSVELSVLATAEVWVCVLNSDGKALVDGQVLADGAREGPFHSDTFTVAFGNGEVEMRIDGKQKRVPESASPLGYEIGRDGALTELSEAERPTCA